MNVLLIAPGTDLAHVNSEVQSVVNALHPTILLGDGATSDALLKALHPAAEHVKQYDLIWFATHGSSTGILLADGVLSAEALTQMLRTQDGAALFLNTCESIFIASRIHNDLSTPIICTISPVNDIDAYRTGALLASNLAGGRTIRDAFDDSKPGNNDEWLYLNDSMRMTRRDRTDDLLAMSYDTIQRQRRMEQQFEDLRNESSGHQPRLTARNARYLAMAMIALFIMLLLGMVQVRSALNLHYEATAIIDLFLIIFFGLLMALAIGIPVGGTDV